MILTRFRLNIVILTAILTTQQCCLGEAGPARTEGEVRTREAEEKGVFLEANEVGLYAPEGRTKEAKSFDDLDTQIEEDRILSMELHPANDQKFKFGQYTPSMFVFKNLSGKALAILDIKCLSKSDEDAIYLRGSAYGSVTKIDDQDIYRYNRLSQRATRESFYAGFLLPGQQISVRFDFQPLALKESFDITYVTASQEYDGTIDSLDPFSPYIPGHAKYSMPTSRLITSRDRVIGGFGNATSSGHEMGSNYYPFVERDWLALHEAYSETGPIGPDVPKRAVLIPDLRKARQHKFVSIPIDYAIKPFALETAKENASRIAGLDPNSFRLTYCNTIGGYVVFEENCIWFLKNKDQTSKRNLFCKCPPSLFKEIDCNDLIRIRVGDKQEGFGPEEHPAGRDYWGTYPVFYGDGMYTRGEFIIIRKSGLAPFLKQITDKGGALTEHAYYFHSRYYELVLPDSNTIEDKNPSGEKRINPLENQLSKPLSNYTAADLAEHYGHNGAAQVLRGGK